MIVGDLVYNYDFDFDVDYEIWGCSSLEWLCNGKPTLLYSSVEQKWRKPLDELLDKEIMYVCSNAAKNVLEIKVRI